MKSFNLMFDEALFSVLPAFIGLVNVNGLIRRTSPFLAIFIEKFWLGRIFMQTAYQNFLSPTIFNKYIDAEFNGVASAKNIVQFLSVSDDRLQMFMNYWGGQDLCQAEYVFQSCQSWMIILMWMNLMRF
ncbi:MAG: hypothetical protein HWD59_08655 [Coxiellaceae bacterium]|nr:MAG: hypothetical protein HWD59_08655 [Coxiellaceae bacterium]